MQFAVNQQPWQRRQRKLMPPARVGGELVTLGFDFLTFLAATVVVIPAFKSMNVSPVLGFLSIGVILQQLRLLHDLPDVEFLSQLGVLFLLFEMGLELSLDRLKALAKFAFGLGSLQVLLCTLAFTALALPAGSSLGTRFLETVCAAPPSLVSIRTLDEAVVIGAALSMSSSAFVLQLLQERGEMPTRFGSATLGILLFQDIAVVPFLVLLPLIESSGGISGASPESLLSKLGPTALTTMAGLGALALGGRLVLRRIFELVAEAKSPDTFNALCLLTVAGTAVLSQEIGLSDTLGAFIAGVLLSETSFRTEVEADIKPFRGLLLGLFFVSVGSSINLHVLADNWDSIAWMLIGLVSLKATILSLAGPLFGLSQPESIRTGFLLSQGGEFAFVLLSLANQLKLLPNDLNQILIIVVVLSMALTPTLDQLGQHLAAGVEKKQQLLLQQAAGVAEGAPAAQTVIADVHATRDDPVIILGFNPQAQVLASMLASPLASSPAYLAFDLDPSRVSAAQRAGLPVLFGNGARPGVLAAAGVTRPRAAAVCHRRQEQAMAAVAALRRAFPTMPIYACAADFKCAAQLKEAGADSVSVSSSEAGLNLGRLLLGRLGTSEADVRVLQAGIRATAAARTDALALQLGAAGGGGAHGGGGGRDGERQVEVFLLEEYGMRSVGSSSAGGGGDVVSALAHGEVMLSVDDDVALGSLEAEGTSAGSDGASGGSANGSGSGGGGGGGAVVSAAAGAVLEEGAALGVAVGVGPEVQP